MKAPAGIREAESETIIFILKKKREELMEGNAIKPGFSLY